MGRDPTQGKAINFNRRGSVAVKVIVNGTMVPQEQSQCSSQGWLDGAGIFETIKTVDGKPWALSRHMRRAVNTSLKTKLVLPGEELVRESISTLLLAEKHPTGLLRISFDATGNWAAVHLPYTELTSAAKVGIHPKALVFEGVPIKSYPYRHRLEILEQARLHGFDEALVTSSSGKICEGSVCNILLKISGTWCTPPLSDGVLAGVVRALVIENCNVAVRSISISELGEIESAFLLSSLRIAQPIASIAGRELSQSHEFRAEIEAMAQRTSVG
jgi:branched-chain amino acid aminotransferase